jgi:hypothetical protein
LLAFKIAELVLGVAAAALQQEPVVAAVQIDAPQLVGARLSGAELVGLVMPTAAAAALPGVNNKRVVRRHHGIDIDLRCRELGGAAGAFDENTSSVAVNACRLTVRRDRAGQQSKEGQSMLHVWRDENRDTRPAAILARHARSGYQGRDNIANPGSNEWPSSTFRSQWATMTAPAL